jgi:hypothetical protein
MIVKPLIKVYFILALYVPHNHRIQLEIFGLRVLAYILFPIVIIHNEDYNDFYIYGTGLYNLALTPPIRKKCKNNILITWIAES